MEQARRETRMPPAVPVTPPAPPPVPRYAPTPEEIVQLTELAKSSRKGRCAARVELAILQCGDTFSLRDIMDVFRKQFGWRGNPIMDQIASNLWKVAREKRFKVVSRGAGRSPTVYSKELEAGGG